MCLQAIAIIAAEAYALHARITAKYVCFPVVVATCIYSKAGRG